MLKVGCVKSGTFKLLVFIWCYSTFFSNDFVLADVDQLSSHVNVSSSSLNTMNYPISGSFEISAILVTNGRGFYPSFYLGLIHSPSSYVVTDTDIFYEYKLAIYFYSNPNDTDPTFVWFYPKYHVTSSHNVTLEFTLDGDLVLRNTKDGKYVWSTNTSNLSVESMHLKDDGNLVFLNRKGKPVWESFRHQSPTNVLLNVKQGLSIGQRLSSSASIFNSTGDYYMEWGNDGVHAYIDFVNPPLQYNFWDYQSYNSIVSRYLKYDYPRGSNFSFLLLDLDGLLKWVDWSQKYSYLPLSYFENQNNYDFSDCYPITCGEYGVCLDNNCRCPIENGNSLNYFRPINLYDTSRGCTLITPLSCSGSKDHDFVELGQVTYFNSTPSLVRQDVESCKTACLQQCSCKAVFFHYHDDDPSIGNCTLSSEVLTLADVTGTSLRHEITFLKVQKNSSTEASSEKKIVISISTSFMFLVFVSGALRFFLMKVNNPSKENDFSLDILVDTISRFSIESLKLATQNFQTRLGGGGFGSVYEGTLVDGTKVSVKCLESCRQGTKEFLAEVNTIGSIHHFNLVKLIGFCDEGFNRLLAYEFMCNGSLDKWIFNSVVHQTLTWSIRRRIIEGVAAGLEYLHEHCQKNVIHFDIKPQNILLDKDFNVKISDFGLAKMVDRDESQVMTVVRGTPGYMAPELINSRAISVKVDVYSLGVVILEIVCGRRNFGSSEEDILTNLVVAKANQDQLFNLIDVQVHDMQQQKEEVVNMMKIAIWCLQPHFIRPTMPKVVTVLQDLSNMEVLNNLSDLTMNIETAAGEETNSSLFRPMDSVLSGPR